MSALPCPSEQSVLRRAIADTKVTSSKRRLLMCRLIPICSCAHSPMISGRWQNTFA